MIASLLTVAIVLTQERGGIINPKPVPGVGAKLKLEDARGEGKEIVIRLTIVNKSKMMFLFDTRGMTGLEFEYKAPGGEFRRLPTKSSSPSWLKEEDLSRTVRIVKSGESATCELTPFKGMERCSKIVGSGIENGKRVGALFLQRNSVAFDSSQLKGNEMEFRCTLVASRGYGLIKKTIEQPGREPLIVEFPESGVVSNTLKIAVPK